MGRITNISANGSIFPRQVTEKMEAKEEAVPCSAAKSNPDGEGEGYGVLLYYKYASVTDLDELISFYESNCRELDLLGRVRVAPQGVNVTVSGKLSSLEEHIDAVKWKPLFEGTDFKLATSHHPSNDQVAKECGFTSLSIRVVDELVTLSSHPLIKSPDISNAGRHLSAAEFHSVLESAGNVKEKEILNDNGGLVLLDARNLYETRIGKFHTPGVETLDPEIRQYSDLTTWIDSNSDRLQGKQILMYCTGGIRCEMASAYIKEKGDGFENVFQLYGGIQRYLEQFPDGGYFKGKNFVFDHRISVGSSDLNILGTCLICGCCCDDYSPRCRCAYCRMLVLVCNKCRMEGARYVCEFCKRHGNASTDSTRQIERKAPQFLGGQAPPRKLRILCLHGFRQNSSGFKGRTASLAKKIKRICDLVYVNGPHELPFIYCPTSASPPNVKCSKKFAWLVDPDYDSTETLNWKAAEARFDPFQYQHQTAGLDASMQYLRTVVSESGPLDGILGFSQGAAMCALVCAEMKFKFAVLCSGYAPKVSGCDFRGSINCPSLHIFGRDCGKDRQISNAASRELVSCFEEGSSVVIEHDSGHIIPTSSPYIDRIKDFLQRFL